MTEQTATLRRHEAYGTITLDQTLYALTGGEPGDLIGMTAEDVRDVVRQCGEPDLPWTDRAIEQYLEELRESEGHITFSRTPGYDR